ncbi:MAG: T9SS type A sorting domain-containing protein [Candidatus Kapabacteria bacterium]|nr:T9SS type A sorting domain-containing protein [Candidatus Kapabacteria bacterium]
MKRILAITVFVAFSSILLFSQNQINHDDLKADIRTYAEQNIHPQMKIWKSEIDKELNSEELAILNSARAKASEFKKDGLEHMRNFTPDRGNKGGKKGKNHPMREQMKEMHTQLLPIIENHSDFFSKLKEEIQPKSEKWQNDMRTMKRDWKQENVEKLECENKSADCPKNGKGMGKHGKGNKFEKNPQHQLMRVMLWDGSSFEDEANLFQKSDQSAARYNANVFPNPANDAINLEFNAPTQGVYELTISDVSGNVVSKQNVNVSSAGKINHVITGVSLGNGVYNYTITTGGIPESGRFVIQR